MGANILRARFFPPPAQLAGCFTSFYLLEVDLAEGESVADHVHPEWANLRFFSGLPPVVETSDGVVLRDASFVVTGPSSRAMGFRMTATRMWGIGLLPLGWAKFMHVPARIMADTVSDGMADPLYAAFAPLCERLNRSAPDAEEQARTICDFFLERDRPVRHGALIHAVNQALVDPDVHSAAALASHAGVTQRTVERLCARYFGFSPQLLVRRQRMMRTLSAFMLAERSNWSAVIDCHYTDHAHFTREFHCFMGMSPTEYALAEHPILAAFMAERTRILGSPVQVLDRPDGQSP